MLHSIHSLPPDTQLGNYRLLEPIGRGGFGLTYMAWDEKLERSVVIKECFPSELCQRDADTRHIRPSSPELEGDYRAALDSLMNEARILASQNHEHIVRVYDVFDAYGSVFYVMPHLEGGSLLTRIVQAEASGHPIPPEQVQTWLHNILSALAYLHSRQLYHRDIKPSNILFDEQDRPVLIDFGAALNMPDVMKTITQGVFTIAYAAPEQITGKGAIGPWTDYYALAATCYRLITGRYVERADARLMHDDTPRLSCIAASKGYPLILIKALEQNLSLPIERRFQSSKDWMSLQQGKMPKLPKLKKITPTSHWVIFGVVLCIACLGFIIELNEPPAPQVTPTQSPSTSTLAARISTSRLDQMKEEVDELSYRFQCCEQLYMADMHQASSAYSFELKKAMYEKKPFFPFNCTALDKRREDAYQEWKVIGAESKKLREAWQHEIARLTAHSPELSAKDQKFFIETLEQYQHLWEGKYSKKLPPETRPDFLDKIYDESRYETEKAAAKELTGLQQMYDEFLDAKSSHRQLESDYLEDLRILVSNYQSDFYKKQRNKQTLPVFDFSLLEQRREKEYQKWNASCDQIKAICKKKEVEIARLSSLANGLNESDKQSCLKKLELYMHNWVTSKVKDKSNQLQLDTPPDYIENNYELSRQQIEEV